MSFSILIPTLNEEKYIGILLSALVQQTDQDFEVIIVDANSSDRTKAVAETFSTKLQLSFHQANQRSVAIQRNLAASQAKRNELVFFDADVKPAPDFLQTLRASVELHALDFATCWNDPLTKNKLDKILFFIFNACYLSPLQHLSPAAVGTFIFVRKDAFDAIGGFDENVVFGEDFDLTRRLAISGYKFAMIKNLRIPFSVRRLDKDGRTRFIGKMLKGALYFYLVGSIKDTCLVTHEFGEHA